MCNQTFPGIVERYKEIIKKNIPEEGGTLPDFQRIIQKIILGETGGKIIPDWCLVSIAITELEEAGIIAPISSEDHICFALTKYGKPTD